MKFLFTNKLLDYKKWPFPSLSSGKFSVWALSIEQYHHVLIPLMIIVFAFQSAGIFYKILGTQMIASKSMRVVKKETLAIKPLSKRPADAYKAVLSRNLLGSTDKALDEKSQIAEALLLSSLLELRGTIVGEGKYGFAVILEKEKNRQILVKAGNRVAGATLLKIARDHVIFKYLGKEEYVKRSNSTEAPIIQGAVGPNPLPPRPSIVVPSSGNITIARSEINEDMKDLGKMLSQARIRPYFSAGMLDGYMISDIRQGSIFQKMGLIEGDIIQGIDNRKFQSADDIMSIFNMMRSASGMNLSIKRAGVMEKMNYIVK